MSLLAVACKWTLTQTRQSGKAEILGRGLTGIAEGNVSVQYQFSSKRGVLLFMRDVTFTRFPIGKRWADKLSRVGDFRDKVIVTETYSCRHYDLRMGKGGELCRRVVFSIG